MSSKKQRRERVEPYSLSNPPNSIDEARSSIDYNLGEMEIIKAQLEYWESDRFESVEAYDDWQDRAIAALAHFRRELNFLNDWTTNGGSLEGLVVLESNQKELQERMDTIVDVIKADYGIPYLDEVDEPQFENAAERRHKLVEMKRRLELATSEIDAECHQKYIDEATRMSMRWPLRVIVNELESELHTLKKFIKDNRHLDQSFDAEVRRCLGALRRLSSGGNELSDCEKSAMKYLKKVG